MMGSMGPFLKDAEFSAQATRINQVIGIESPPESWDDLAKSCRKLETNPLGATTAEAKAKPKARGGSSMFGLGIGGGGSLLGALGGPPLTVGSHAQPSLQTASTPAAPKSAAPKSTL